MGAALSIASQCTSDVLFDEAFCDEPAPYDSHKCFFNRTGSTIWISGLASTYKLGLCVEQGTVHDVLTYTEHSPHGVCGYGYPGGTALNYYIGAGGYINWTWTAGNWWRTYTHTTTEGSGDIFDHGQRWDYEPDCL